MRKKILIFIFILLILVTVCTKKTNEKTTSKGKIYERVLLNDPQNNVNVFSGLIPKGWNTYIESKWDVISSSVPGYETVRISSPDSRASIIMISQKGYVENEKYAEGENYEYYTTYLHYMDASTYLDYFINQNYSGSNLKNDLEINEDYLNQLKSYNNIKLELAKNDAEELNKVTPSVTIGVSPIDATAAKKQYEYGSNVLEASTAISAIKTNLDSSLSPLLSSESISWIIPYTIVFQAEDEQAFKKYYNDYSFIVANSQFTVDYYAMVEYVSSYIVNSYTSYYAAKSKASLDAMNEYIDSNYSSTSAESTNEKVMQMWDDYINEVDVYVTDDGSKIQTSMYNETVAQNGDEFYVGTKAGILLGFNELTKDH